MQSTTQYKSIINDQDCQRLLLEEENENLEEWEIVKNDPNIKVYRHKFSKIPTFKSKFYFQSPANLLYSLTCNLNIRKKWDPIYIAVRDVEKIDENYDILYTQLKTPIGVSPRDSCFLRYRCCNASKFGEEYFVICKTVSHPSCPVPKNFVRTVTPFHGYIVRDEEPCDGKNRSLLFLYSEHDFGGFVPHFIVNYAIKHTPIDFYTKCNKVIEKLMREEKEWRRREEEKEKKLDQWPHASFIKSKL